MREITYREAVAEYAAGIAAVQAYTWLTTYHGLVPQQVLDDLVDALPARAERMEETLERGGHICVALDGRTVVGFASWTEQARSDAFPEDGEIMGLYVFKGYQGMGIGRRLFEICAGNIRAAGRSSVIVNCLRGNPAAGFYRRMGGEMVGLRTDTLRGGAVLEEFVFQFAI